MTQPDKVPSLATQPPSWVWPSPRKDQRDDVDCGLDDDDSDDDLCSSQALNQILAAERAAYAAIAAAQTVQCMCARFLHNHLEKSCIIPNPTQAPHHQIWRILAPCATV